MTELSRPEAVCKACSTPAAGRFCASCGAPLQTSPGSKSLRWTAATIAVVAVVAYFAGNAIKPVDPATGMTQQVPLTAPTMEAPQSVVRAPDISGLSPQERADRLYNRVMLLARQGKTDSVMFFAPMAIQAYLMMNPLGADQRYDTGRIAEVAGALALAKAQASAVRDARRSVETGGKRDTEAQALDSL